MKLATPSLPLAARHPRSRKPAALLQTTFVEHDAAGFAMASPQPKLICSTLRAATSERYKPEPRQMDSTEQYLFACGDFQQTAVQIRIFGRPLAGKPDALVGFCREPFSGRPAFQMTVWTVWCSG